MWPVFAEGCSFPLPDWMTPQILCHLTRDPQRHSSGSRLGQRSLRRSHSTQRTYVLLMKTLVPFVWPGKIRNQWLQKSRVAGAAVSYILTLVWCLAQILPLVSLSLSFLLYSNYEENLLRWGNSGNNFSAAKKVLGTEGHAATLSFGLKSFQSGNSPLSVWAGYL